MSNPLFEAIQTNMQDPDYDEEKLINWYQSLTPEQKDVVGEFCVHLTGWSLDSLLEQIK